ncbi:class I adenylate-forming enzyme family protein [Tomitella biformata]|uniref:class I adenylate-forming enzyme family protein n=1 Tax=Tomitella biformata TaxID=630403 RepID=UPI0004BAF438|nr:AMP-binding protein [Tomitella biformata]
MLTTRTDFLAGTIDYPDLTTATLPATAARLYGDRHAFVFGDKALTYAEFGTQSGRFAAALRASGIGRGDIVLMHMANGIEFVVAYYGTLRSGATVSLVNPLQPAEGLHSQLLDTAARAVVTQAAQAPIALAAVAGTAAELVIVDAPGGLDPNAGASAVEFWDFTGSAAEEYTCTDLCGDDIAHVSYTGGTTGIPKGVRVLHRNVLANVAQTMMARTGHQILRRADGQFGFSEDVRPGSWEMGLGEDVGIVVSPLFHVHALVLLNSSLLSGVTSVFTGRFAPAVMLELIERHRVTAISGSPAMWHALAAHPDARTRDLSSVRVITSGAAPLDLPTAESLRAMFQSAQVGEGYGMTEATAVVTVPPMTGRYPVKDGSVGVPLFDTEVQVRALDGSGAVLAANERGTLWVHGPQVADGYLNKPEATAAQFVDGWLDTGDVGHVDEDGFVFISDRIKDMLLYKGYNVYPREIEDILVTHPGVDAAAVVGRSSPEVGEEPVGFVVPVAGSAVSEQELMEFVAARVLPYQKLRDVVFLEQLPVTATGKISKVALRGRL